MKYARPQPFPLELIEQIFEYLQDDIPSLSACGLVCRSWVSPAQFLLFREVRLYAESPTRGVDCAKLLENNPHVASFVKTLHLRLHQPDPTNPDFPAFKRLVNSVCAMRLPNLKSLSVNSYTKFDELSLDIQSALIHGFGSIRSLVLDWFLFSNPRDFLCLIAAHTNLERLVLLQVGFQNESGIPKDTPSRWEAPGSSSLATTDLSAKRHTKLQDLVVDDTCIELIDVLSHFRNLSIKRFIVTMNGISEFKFFGGLLHRIGPSLEYLAVALYDCNRLETDILEIDGEVWAGLIIRYEADQLEQM